jgi:hypothetical protein
MAGEVIYDNSTRSLTNLASTGSSLVSRRRVIREKPEPYQIQLRNDGRFLIPSTQRTGHVGSCLRQGMDQGPDVARTDGGLGNWLTNS